MIAWSFKRCLSFFFILYLGRIWCIMTKNKLKKVREERLLSKSELAKMAGVSPLTIDRIEKDYPCRMETKRKILQALGIKLSDREQIFKD